MTRKPNRSTPTEPSFRSEAAIPTSVARQGPRGRFWPLVSPRATMDTTAQRTRPPSRPRHRQGGSRSITRCLESACAIAASAPAVAGVPRWLRAYRGRASARSCCRAEPLIPAHHHAFGNALFRLPPETRRACPTAFWPHSAGSTASGRYYADDRPSSFRLRRNGIGAASGSPIIVDLAGAQPRSFAHVSSGYK